MWAMRCIWGALGCAAWVFLVIGFFSSSSSGIIRSSFYAAIMGAMLLAPTGGVIAALDPTLRRWRRIVAITVGIIIPGVAILALIAFIASLDQLTY